MLKIIGTAAVTAKDTDVETSNSKLEICRSFKKMVYLLMPCLTVHTDQQAIV
jgi:hypothetical protein